MKTATDYIAAATAEAEAAPAPEAAAPEVPAPVAAAAVESDVQPEHKSSTPAAPVEGSAPAATPEAKPETKPADRVTKSYEDVARERVALRAEKAELAEYRAYKEAATRGDAMALLAAAKIPWSKAAQQVLEGHSRETKPVKEEPDEREQRIAALEQEISTQKARETRATVMSALQTRTKADPAKFKLTAAMGEEAKAISYLEQYFNQFKEMPGESFDESMEIALEAVETALVRESKRWSPVLTSTSGTVTVPASKSAVPAAGAVSQQAPKTLTNGTGAGPSQAPTSPKKPKTSDDYIAAAIEAANSAQ